MVVQHNLTAMNANRQLSGVQSAQQKSTEKLSSGYRINRAGDDAAGLSISEKMRSQIRGLNKAASNAQDGISLVQVAEGALNETHSILQRMNELATQAANDTNTSTDRNALQQEMDQLTSEIDRIRSTTQFNSMNLLDGTFTGKNLQVGALSLAVQYYAEPYVVANVPPNCFMPRPKVGSAVIRLTKYKDAPIKVTNEKLLFQLIRASFNQRRKTLQNGIKNFGGLNFSKEQVAQALEEMELPASVRGEALTLEQFAQLSNILDR